MIRGNTITIISSGITPSGSLSITENGAYDVMSYASAIVSVPGIDTSDATLSSGWQMLSGITAYASGIKYTGTLEDYMGSVNSGSWSAPIYSGSYRITPTDATQSFPTAGMFMTYDLIVNPAQGTALKTHEDSVFDFNEWTRGNASAFWPNTTVGELTV